MSANEYTDDITKLRRAEKFREDLMKNGWTAYHLFPHESIQRASVLKKEGYELTIVTRPLTLNGYAVYRVRAFVKDETGLVANVSELYHDATKFMNALPTFCFD